MIPMPSNESSEVRIVPVDATPTQLQAAFGAARLSDPDWLATRYRAMVYAAPEYRFKRITDMEILTLHARVMKAAPVGGAGVQANLIAFAQAIENHILSQYV